MSTEFETELDETFVTATPESLSAAGLRRLEWNELVRKGDFVVDGHDGFEPWEGPSGFMADSFVKPTYRRIAKRSKTATKSSSPNLTA